MSSNTETGRSSDKSGPERAENWQDRLIPSNLLHDASDDVRAARVLLTGVLSATVICLLFTIIHWANGNKARAIVSALTCIPIAGALPVLWSTGRVLPAVHYLLGLCTAIVTVSPFLSNEGEPAIIALVIVPVAASLMAGARAGAIWTTIITALLIGYASIYPFSDAKQEVAWLTAIMAGGGGIAATLIERGREHASREAKNAVESAEADAQNRLRAEIALRESQALFGRAFRRSSSLMIFVSIETGRILDVNESFVRTMGWSVEEAVGRKVSELNAWTTPSDQGTVFGSAINKGSIDSIEIRMQTKSGVPIWLLGSMEVLKQDGLSCLFAEGVDITERKRGHEELAQYRVELENRFAARGEELAASRERLRQRDRLAVVGTLAAGVAHQINNPIGGIVAATEFAVIMDDDPDREQIRTDALATALDEAKRCGRIVKNVLKFSRDEPTAKWNEDIKPTVLRATHLARNHVSNLGGRVELDLSPASLEVRMSPIDIEQVVLNLIHNASESRKDGADVRVQTRRRANFAEIVITDNGEGIDPKARPHIFEPFFTSRLAEGGTGLGLSVVHGIVADHQGKLEVQGAAGGGTCVRVLLPLVGQESSEVA